MKTHSLGEKFGKDYIIVLNTGLPLPGVFKVEIHIGGQRKTGINPRRPVVQTPPLFVQS